MALKKKKIAAILVFMILVVAAVFYYFSNRNQKTEYQGTFVQEHEEAEYEYASVDNHGREASL